MKETLNSMTRYMPGLILISLGLIVMVFPMLLVAFVSALLLMAGIMAIIVARKTKRLEQEMAGYCFSGPFERPFWASPQRVFHHYPRW